ncbi:hypothetical protein [Acetoanaerobium sticklandii]|uniref:hypothetical protein n=1 Tax=Acetoanaerobium sticklandii TaxID=1511 RepID=UPI003A8E3BF7
MKSSEKTVKNEDQVQKSIDKEICLIIMPFSDIDGYETNHFAKVYEHMIKKPVEDCGYEPYRIDEMGRSGIIHLDLIKKLYEAPMAVCDLSGRNPNVLFELGFRQAFDKPTVLIKDDKTPWIFDVANINSIEYSSSRVVENVLEVQQKIRNYISNTKNSQDNSLVKLLGITEALVSKTDPTDDDKLALVLNEISSLKKSVFDLQNISPSNLGSIWGNNKYFNLSIEDIENRYRQLKQIYPNYDGPSGYYEAEKIKNSIIDILDAAKKHNNLSNDKILKLKRMEKDLDNYIPF